MKKYFVEIEGIVPMLFNRFTEKNKETLDKKTQGRKKNKTERIEEAYEKCYRKNGFIGVPAINIKKSMLNGCQSAGIKLGRRSAMPYMRALVHLDTDFCSLNKKDPDGIHEGTGRIPPRTGSMVIIRRPYVDTGWKLKFGIYVIDERISPEIVKESLEEAGLVIGLCDHRPDFGRFKVNKFEAGSGKDIT